VRFRTALAVRRSCGHRFFIAARYPADTLLSHMDYAIAALLRLTWVLGLTQTLAA
jgi:hypothetical protein